MKWFKSFMFLAFVLLSVQVSTAKPEAEIEELKARVKMLEDYKTNLNTLADARSEGLKSYVDKEVKQGMKDIDEAKKTLDTLVWIGIPVTIGTFVIGFISLLMYSRKLVAERIATIVEKKREDIIRLVETETSDNKLRNSKELLVISGDEESSESIKKFLEKLKFKKVTFRIAGTFDDIPEHDLMIFNTPQGELSQESIDELMQKSEDEDNCYVAYSTKRLEPNLRLNFSNSRFTLYHSILSTLKYSEIAKLIEVD